MEEQKNPDPILLEREKLAFEEKKHADTLILEKERLAIEQQKNVLACWEKTVDVQQHFNDIGLRIRTGAVTLLTAIFGVSAFTVKENLRLVLFNLEISVASVLMVFGGLAWLAFYFMDQNWYHKFLRAAGKHAMAIEERWRSSLPEIALATTITEASREGRKAAHPAKPRSAIRLRVFYFTVAGLTFLIAGAVQVGTHLNIEPSASSSTQQKQTPAAIPTATTPPITPVRLSTAVPNATGR